MTNSGGGCGLHCGGGIELVDVCRARVGRIDVVMLLTWIDAERIGAGILFRGGMAGGGPRDAVAVFAGGLLPEAVFEAGAGAGAGPALATLPLVSEF